VVDLYRDTRRDAAQLSAAIGGERLLHAATYAAKDAQPVAAAGCGKRRAASLAGCPSHSHDE
jgi:hypothetical protein